MVIDGLFGDTMMGRFPPVENVVMCCAWWGMAGVLWMVVLRRSRLESSAEFLGPGQEAIPEANRRRWQRIIASSFLGGASLLVAGWVRPPMVVLVLYLSALILGFATVWWSLSVFRGLLQYEQAIGRAQAQRVQQSIAEAQDQQSPDGDA